MKKNISRKTRIFMTVGALLVFILLVFTHSDLLSLVNRNKELTLRDIAYDSNPSYGYKVYIKETSGYIPYLVLSKDYSGKEDVLLLRENLFNDSMMFNDNYRYSGYYENSNIDDYLDKRFVHEFSPSLSSQILDSEIAIISRDSLGIAGEDIKNISRKVFLLSYTEVGLGARNDGVAVGGRPLKYFKDVDSRVARKPNGNTHGWWLRTSAAKHDTTAWLVGWDAEVTGEGVHYESGIRPAFALSSDTVMTERDDIVDGETVFVVD